ncbi:RNA polymerase Rpc34 subunit-domain-containing protein [Epithele typhae]|uniref:RNA polymerase Rpc34 subunit-domain-containing protein n=1 Tax=Epithele typhae TaxID=378194 RepID=UPI00200843CC|nr:RNA polymerase Rpc34 subunit-domain-containing protein [Epithele typhae]KAH9937795.1 RNA polymerase Rpc34 subunit-domain-containing protein [Epithele typhae]
MSGRKLSALEQKLHQAALADSKKTITQKECDVLIPDAAARTGAINFLLGTGLLKAMKDTKGQLSFRAVMRKELEVKKDMSGEESMILSHIQAANNEGIWTKHLKAKTELHQTVIDRCIKSLTQKQLIKSVKSVKYPTRKIYMLFHLEPSVEMTGGPWYTDNELDSEFIKLLCSACLRFIRDRSTPKQKGSDASSSSTLLYPISAAPQYPTAQQVMTFLSKSRITETQLSVEHVEMLLNVLVLDGDVERVPGFGAVMWDASGKADASGDEEPDSDRRAKSKAKDKEKAKKRKRKDRGRDDSESPKRTRKRSRRASSSDDDSDSESDSDDGDRRRKSRKHKKNRSRVVSSDDEGSDSDRERRKKKGTRSKKRSRAGSGDDRDADGDIAMGDEDRKGKKKRKKSRRHDSSDDDSRSEDNSDSESDSDARSRSRSKSKSKSRSRKHRSPSPAEDVTAALLQEAQEMEYSAYVYRAVRQERMAGGAGLTQTPCVRCPTFEFCNEGGPANPKECTYYGSWLVAADVAKE